MMLYVLIGLSLSLLGVAGLQFFYQIYLERIDREQKKRIHELERHCRFLTNRVNEAEAKENIREAILLYLEELPLELEPTAKIDQVAV